MTIRTARRKLNAAIREQERRPRPKRDEPRLRRLYNLRFYGLHGGADELWLQQVREAT